MTATFDLSQTDHLLSTTRSVRKRLDLDRPVEREVVLDALRLAIQAPTGSNSQKWRWLVIDDPAKRAALADMYRATFMPYMEANKAAAEARGETTMTAVSESAIYLAERLQDVPVHVIPVQLDRLSENASVTEAASYYGSILPAVWSFMLALRSRGLGSAWTTLHLAQEHDAAELLGIPATVTQTALIPVAYYTGDDFKPARRRPIEQITYFNTWGEKAT